MRTFDVTILGSMAAMPHQGKITSAQIVQYENQFILIDCGEATQINIAKYKIHSSKISTICISHLHGDHIFGLPGLLSSFTHHQRKNKLVILGPAGIRKYVDFIVEITYQRLSYPVDIFEFSPVDKIHVLELPGLEIYAFPLEHRIETLGYIIKEKILFRNILEGVIKEYDLHFDQIKKIKDGEDLVLRDGTIIKNDRITHPERKPRSYAYCSDTVYTETIVPYIQGVSCLYHEATYLHESLNKAQERKHSTAKEAATIAKLSGVGKLIIGHFSSRYNDFNVLLEEAKEIFPEVYLGLEGTRHVI